MSFRQMVLYHQHAVARRTLVKRPSVMMLTNDWWHPKLFWPGRWQCPNPLVGEIPSQSCVHSTQVATMEACSTNSILPRFLNPVSLLGLPRIDGPPLPHVSTMGPTTTATTTSAASATAPSLPGMHYHATEEQLTIPEKEQWIAIFDIIGGSQVFGDKVFDAATTSTGATTNEIKKLDRIAKKGKKPKAVAHHHKNHVPRDSGMGEEEIRFHALKRVVAHSLSKNEPLEAMAAFRRGISVGTAPKLPDQLLRSLLLAFVSHPAEAFLVYSVIQSVTERTRFDSELALHRRMCELLRFLDPEQVSHDNIQAIVRNVMKQLSRLPREGQELCYPIMVSSLVQQRASGLTHVIRTIYDHMVANDLVVRSGYWEHLLSLSRYHRRDDLPYDEILERTVKLGNRPHPTTVLNAIANLYPFHNVEATFRMLKSFYELKSTEDTFREHVYIVDVTLLEAIGSAASMKGFINTNLIIWDLLDLTGQEPTEAIYENTIIGFCADSATYDKAFRVLFEMEMQGIRPSRPLIRSMSALFRMSFRNIAIAVELLKQYREGSQHVSVAGINAVLSGAAELGDIRKMQETWNEFSMNGLQADSDSYSFALECLGKNMARLRRSKTPIDYPFFTTAAESLLSKMESQGVRPTTYVIRDYVELLCLAGDVATATAVVRDLKDVDGLISSKAMYRVCVANAKRGEFAIAKSIAMLSKDHSTHLMNIIKHYEDGENWVEVASNH